MRHGTVLCPLVQRQIESEDCYEIALMQEGELSADYLPDEFKPKGWRVICGQCTNHP